jgi:uncharacterized protein
MRSEPDTPDPTWPRYTRAPFPPYRFVPGRSPHPRRDPRGHGHGLPEPAASPVDPEGWAASEAYLRGVDLYNFAYWWEAHEAFEALWHGAREDPQRGFFQALVQVSASELKRFMGAPDAARSIAARALPRLRAAPDFYMGFDIRRFERDFEARAAGERPSPALILLAPP